MNAVAIEIPVYVPKLRHHLVRLWRWAQLQVLLEIRAKDPRRFDSAI